MIRYYESIGLIRSIARTEGNYRTYEAISIQRLRFIARARALGFSVNEIGRLLTLWQRPKRQSSEVKMVALAHMADLDEKIRGLQSMRAALKKLTDHCHGDEQPECPILDELSGDQPMDGGLRSPRPPHD